MRITFAPWGETLAELADAARRAELAGAEVVWAPELHRSATVSAAALIQATSTARVGTAIALAFTRSPMVTALEALDLDELSGGRFVLGLGTGVQRLNEDWHHARWGKPVGHLRETVRNIRHFVAHATSGDEMALEGEFEPMRIRGYERPYPVQRTEIPVYLAAMGPAMTRLAARIGDGWISHELCSPAYLAERILPEIDAGLAQAEGRSRQDVELVVSACCSVDADPASALERVRGHVGFYASVRTYADFFAFHGLGEAQQRVVEAFRSGRGAEHLAQVVTPEMVDAVTLNGDRDRVVEQLAAYDGLADAVKLSAPTHGLTPAEIRAGQDQVVDLIETLTGGRP
ncbi:LLM class flavin-dependent oxidoreductase [Nocardioides sp. cx-173]|uniref:LLM class flavin-dependent oxidoreductase n=1 Tax=Nocardioides sp. cx-173 TaxID=2898796 RepID=UPI001E2CE195|nr:LLM class flavin-dependent oxidoreductase [Nocardioides sp. cx-173]MCD4524373.1 LLM class flavin-dependent oxidoreductase [Nocardioides sp. cx-173]UGB43139.1 LLM class flavin-dependent oxidoreductase [Nocardioides sp. cx-173]